MESKTKMSLPLNKDTRLDHLVSVNTDLVDTTIDWKRYVDGIYCINYLPYKERRKECEKELAAMDILHSPIFQFHWTYHNRYDAIILEHMNPPYKDFHNDRKELVTNLTMAYYQILREAQERDQSSILTIEDDIRFVCNKWTMKNTLDRLPSGWDYIQFDKLLNNSEKHRLVNLATDGYYIFNYQGGYWGTVFTMWSRKAIDYTVALLENQLWPIDYAVVNRDDDTLNQLKRYTTVQSLVHQDGQDIRYRAILF